MRTLNWLLLRLLIVAMMSVSQVDLEQNLEQTASWKPNVQLSR
jgi:hypothetical protein